MRLPRLPTPAVAGRLARAEAATQLDRWFLWSPVAFGGGCAIYLVLRTEPPAALCLALASAGLLIAWLANRRQAAKTVAVAATLLAFLACGFGAAKLRTLGVTAPVIAAPGPRTLEAWVVDVPSPGSGGGRLLLAPQAISGLDPSELPRRVRITVGPDAMIGPGAYVRLRGTLNPPPGPASPGAYDFARDAFFHRVGGVGFAFGEPAIVAGPEPPWPLALRMRVNAARWSLARRIVDRLGERTGGVAVAMVTGHEAWLRRADEDAMRAAGLAHILSISGVHMAIVGGFVFFLFRVGVAAWPWLALRAPGKKIAAAAGLLAVAVYLVVSGAPAPAIRAAVVMSVVFLAVLTDRQAISLHSLAVAALLVLALQPEAVGQPGFQMSFAATAALVALAEARRPPIREINAPWPIRLLQGAGTWIVASIGISFVAGLATGPFAIQHFNRVALYGLPANLLLAPLSSFVIMPGLAAGAALETIGLGALPLAFAGKGIEAMLAVAQLVASRPGTVRTVASAPDYVLAISFLGILWLCLWRGRLRWLGLPLALAVSLWPRPAPPAAWIAPDGGAAAVVSGNTAVLLRPEAKAFATELWARRRGLALPADSAAARSDDYDCNRLRCFGHGSARPAISAWWTRRAPKPADLARLCAAEIAIIKPDAFAGACPRARVLTEADFRQGGAAEIYPSGSGGWRFVWAEAARGRRPWSVSGSGG
ncbi:MAG TPA: ComEC/Rec2 family competence protein [Caulobacteraceae bacterium]|jgi:competence protein ComEC